MSITWNKDRENLWWRDDNAVCMINAVIGHDAEGYIVPTKLYTMTLEISKEHDINIHLSRTFTTLDKAKTKAEDLITLSKALVTVLEMK